ncbi:MAG: hypothetical protein AAGK05_13355, partial [Pseudomonadota bacterium]
GGAVVTDTSLCHLMMRAPRETSCAVLFFLIFLVFTSVFSAIKLFGSQKPSFATETVMSISMDANFCFV